MTLSESGLPLSPMCLHPDLLPSSGHCMGKDTGNERRLLPLVGRQGVPCLRAASSMQSVIPPLCAPDQSQHRGAILPGHPTPVARVPHQPPQGSAKKPGLGSHVQSWERSHCTSTNLSFLVCFMDRGVRSLVPPSPVPCVNGHTVATAGARVRMMPPFWKQHGGRGPPARHQAGPFPVCFPSVPTVSTERVLLHTPPCRQGSRGPDGDRALEAQGRQAATGLTGADVQALAVLLQPLDPLLQLALQRVVQQQLLTLQKAWRLSWARRAATSSPPGTPIFTSRCCLAPCSSHSYLFLITSRQKPL